MKKIVLLITLLAGMLVYNDTYADRSFKIELKNTMNDADFAQLKSFLLTKKGILTVDFLKEKNTIQLSTEDRMSETEIKELFKHKEIETLNF